MTLESFRALVKKCVEEEPTDENVRLIVSDLETSGVEFLDVIQTIGPGLVDSDKNIRLNATKLLSDVVSRLKASFFNQNEVDVLVEFLCAKFTDHHLIAPTSFKGLVALTRAEAFSGSTMKILVRSIFRDLTVQTLVLGDRTLIYSLFDSFLKNYMEDLKEMNGEFVSGFVQMADSERDPRNLICVFKMISTIASNIPLGAMVQDLFELVSEYFPIEFEPGPNNISKITREDLSIALKSCFVASPQFSDYSLPLLIEKMSSDSSNSRLDSMEYLSACCEVYPSDKISEFAGRIWAVIRQNIFSSKQDPDVGSLSTLTAIILNLSRNVSDVEIQTTQEAARDVKKEGVQEEANKNVEMFVDLIFKDCSRYFLETSLQIFHQSVKTLHAATSASAQSFNHLLGKTIDVLLKQFDSQRQTEPRVQFVKALLLFIDYESAPLPLHRNETESSQRWKSSALGAIISSRKEKIFQTITSIRSSQDPELQDLSVRGMLVLLSLDSFSSDEKNTITGYMADSTISCCNQGPRDTLMNCLEKLALMRGDLCKSIILPRILSAIHSELENSNTQADYDANKLKHLVFSLACASTGEELVSEAMSELMAIIADQCRGNNGELISSFCTKALGNIIRKNAEGETKEYFASWFLPRCLELILKISRENSSAEGDRSDIGDLCICIRTVVQACDIHLIGEFVERIVALFLKTFEECQGKAEETSEEIKTSLIRTLLHLVLASVCSVKDHEQIKDVNKVMIDCFELATKSNDPSTSLVSSKCLASLVNKATQVGTLDELLHKTELELHDRLARNVQDSSENEVGRQEMNCVLWSWLTKALVARNHAKQTLFANQMVDMLSVPHLSSLASDGFRVVLNDSDEVLAEKSHSNITLMYKQRFFALTIHRLVDSFNVSNQELKKHFLSALSCLNNFVPKQAIQQELALILPLLLQSLGADNSPEVWTSSLSTLRTFITSSPDDMGRYFDNILPRLLEISRHAGNMTVRIEALKCLALLPGHLPASVLLPSQRRVIRDLSVAVDDRKRLVRRQASLARSAWYLVDEEKDHDEE